MDPAAAGQAQRLFDMAASDGGGAADAVAAAADAAAAASEAAAGTYPPQALFVTPTSAADAAGGSTEPSPGGAAVTAHPPPPGQEQQLHQLKPCPAPVQEQRTIFVAGFPVDMTEREFHFLLTFLPGYEACQLGWGTGSPQGFALFRCNADAVAAVDRLAGHQVEVGSVLRAELAHKNLVIKKDLPVNGTQLSLLNNIQARTEALLSPGLGLPFASTAGVLHNAAQPVLMHPGYNSVMQPAAAGGLGGSPALLAQNWRGSGLGGGNARDNAPCNTLFIGNLGENTREEELHQLMASQAGFRQLKWSPTGKGVIAFVEFDDVTSATYVHSALQGVVLPSNDRGGLRIQFSKNPLGKRSPMDASPNLHGLFAAANPVAATAMQPSALYNVTLANPVNISGLAPAGSYLAPMEMPTVSHQAAAATAAAMAAVVATQGMANHSPLFGPVGTMLL